MLRRKLSLAVLVLLHTTGHAGLCIAHLCFLMNSFLACLLFLSHLLVVNQNRTSLRNWVRFEVRSSAFHVQSCFRLWFLHHLRLVAIPKRKRRLTLFCYLYTVLFYSGASFFVRLHDLVIPWLKNIWWDRLATESVTEKCFFLVLFLFNHVLNFPFSYRFGSYLVTYIETKGFRNCHTVTTFLLFIAKIIVVWKTLFSEILINRSRTACVK